MILRIIDKQTSIFIRDDFTFNEETEIGLEVEASQGLYLPKWDFELEEWVEGATQEYIDSLKAQPEPQEPSLEERIQALEVMELERILGGVF